MDVAENVSGTAGTLLKTTGHTMDALSNALGFVSENFTTILTVSTAGYFLNKLI